MILPYLARLVCLCLAAFFLVHARWDWRFPLLTPWAVRFAAGRMAPVYGARAAAGAAALSGRLRAFRRGRALHPQLSVSRAERRSRRDGRGLYGRGAGWASIWGFSLARATRAMARSAAAHSPVPERSREMRSAGRAEGGVGHREDRALRDATPECSVRGSSISRAVVAALSAEQLSAVIRHERAHGVIATI
jgi:hypothetical protein